MAELRDATVLVVDDEPDLRDMLAFEFHLCGTRVLEAGDGQRALDIVDSENVDAVITDIRMPGKNGIELLEAMGSRPGPKPPVIFITAYDSDLPPPDAFDKGADEIFAKPFSLRALVSRVQQALVPIEQRWGLPPSIQADCDLLLRFSELEEARKERLIDLGRGGFAVRTRGLTASVGNMIGFDITFETGSFQGLSGCGKIKWIQDRGENAPCCYGVEFSYLEPESRTTFLTWLSKNSPCPFIPRL